MPKSVVHFSIGPAFSIGSFCVVILKPFLKNVEGLGTVLGMGFPRSTDHGAGVVVI